MDAFAFVKVAPMHHETVYSLHGPFEIPVYPKSPDGELLRIARMALDLTQWEAAARIGITPLELNGLEHGKLKPVLAATWAQMEARLADTRKGGG